MHTVYLILLTNAIVGIVALEWAYRRLQIFTSQSPKEHDEKYPSQVRGDKKINKWEMYPLAATILIPKLCFMIILIILSVLCTPIIFFRYNKKEDHPVGLRRTVVHFIIYFFSNLVLLVMSVKVNYVHKDFDYSYYLGPDYKLSQKVPLQASTIVANHHSSCDPFILLLYRPSSFVANGDAIGWLYRVWMGIGGTLFVTNNDTPEKRKQSVQIIKNR